MIAKAVGNGLGLAGLVALFICVLVYAKAPAGSDRRRRTALLAASSASVASVSGVLDGDWFVVITNAATAVIWLWLWDHTRRNGKRAVKSLGAKSRAIRDAIVRKAREAAQPRPVLRPVRGAAS